MVRLNAKYVSYLPAMVAAIQNTDGPVLELGCGIGTFTLHWICLYQGKQLISCENNEEWYKFVQHCASPLHEVRLVNDWREIAMGQPWGAVLVDQAPAEDRNDAIRRLADHAQAIVIHDAQGRSRKHYHYEEIWPLFKYIRGYNLALPHSVVVSNFVDVNQW